MRPLFILILAWVIAAGLSLPAAGQVNLQWVETFVQQSAGHNVSVDRAGNLVIAGISVSVNGYDYLVVKYSPDGDTLWSYTYDSPTHTNDLETAMVLDSADNICLTGQSVNGSSLDFLTMKINPMGELLWQAFCGIPTWDEERPLIAVDPYGNVYVTGEGIGNGLDYLTVKYNATGHQLWTAQYNGPLNNDSPTAIVADAQGNCYVTGKSRGLTSGGATDYATVKYSPEGMQLWVQRYNGPGDQDDVAEALTLDASGNCYVTGYSYGELTNYDYATLKYSPAGDLLWVARYGYCPTWGPDKGRDLALDAESNVYVTGISWSPETGDDFATIKYDTQGNQLWVARHDQIGAGHIIHLALDNAANVYIAEMYNSLITFKYSTNGNELWSTSYPGTDYNPFGLVVDGFHNIYLTGIVSWHATTLKYNQPARLTIDLTPVNPPIIIPASGGSFSFNAALSNQDGATRQLQVWTMVQLPNQVWYGPVMGPVTLTLPFNQSLSRLRVQTVPGSAPAGAYLYRGYTGQYSGVRWDSSSFPFTKSETDIGGPGKDSWSNNGETFEAAETSDPGQMTCAPRLRETIISTVSPNPFNPTTAISYQLSAISHVSLKIYDISGRLISTLVEGMQEAGQHSVTFDGAKLPSGIYLYFLTAGQNRATGKLVLMN